MPEIGVVSTLQAERLGAVGPAARAAGLAQDVRSHSPLLAYEGFTPVVPERAAGDVQARLEQRALELWQSLRSSKGCSSSRSGPLLPRPVAVRT